MLTYQNGQGGSRYQHNRPATEHEPSARLCVLPMIDVKLVTPRLGADHQPSNRGRQPTTAPNVDECP